MKLTTYLSYIFALLVVSFVISSCLNDDNLIPENCFDGELNNEEWDVDCGGPNCDPCPPSCDNGLWDVDFGEIDVDCGGPNCDPCPTCNDGILNQDELGVDCGGETCEPCSNATTDCTNGILDDSAGEQGIDCGGPDCPPCPEPSCDDGIQNQGEAGIDCGGDFCPACPAPTCGDGVINQDETGVDCGGIFCDPCQVASQGQIIFRMNNGDMMVMNGTAMYDDETMIMSIQGALGEEEFILAIPGAGLTAGVDINFNATTYLNGYIAGYAHPTLGNYISSSSASNFVVNFDTVDNAGGSALIATFSGIIQNFGETFELNFTEGSFNLIVQ